MENKKFKNQYRVESARLKDYDYSQNGAYFITICTKDKESYFGKIVNNKLNMNWRARICYDCWLDLPKHYRNCVLDEFVVMPNHVHMIIFIDNKNNISHMVETGLKPVSTGRDGLKCYSISEIIRGFKTFTARKINIYDKTFGRQLWQARFYDHIIWNEDELNNIRQYIIDNPFKWGHDIYK